MSAASEKPALATPAETETKLPNASEDSKVSRRASTSAWRPLADLQHATLPQDGRPETSEAQGIPPGGAT